MNNESSPVAFFSGLFSVAIIYAMAFAVYQWGFGNGKDSAKCKQRHSYHMTTIKPAFLARK